MINRLTPVVKNLLLINLIIFVLNIFVGPGDVNLLAQYFGLRTFNAPEFQPYQILTYMFVHDKASFWHIFGNMLALFFFGPWLENVFGSRKFLAFYMITGMGAGVLNSGVNYYFMTQQKADVETYMSYENPSSNEFVQYLHKNEPEFYVRDLERIDRLQTLEEAIEFRADTITTLKQQLLQINNPEDKKYLNKLIDDIEAQQDTLVNINANYQRENEQLVQATYKWRLNTPTVGASGAVFGILIAFALIFPNMTVMLLIPPIPVQAKYLAIFYLLFELYNGIQVGYGGATDVAHFAHLGGALVGFILVKLWGIKRQY